VLAPFAALAPLHAVRGNIDERATDLPDAVSVSLVDAAEGSGDIYVALRLWLTHIAVAGPRLRTEVANAAAEHRCSLVVCGHSHVPFIGRSRGITMFNPGSIGPRRFGLPIVFGLIEIEGGKLSMQHIDCETGSRWMPP
jgi:putative phosphoesterase